MAVLARRKGTRRWYIQWYERGTGRLRVKATGTEDEAKAREILQSLMP